jgi:chromate transporter
MTPVALYWLFLRAVLLSFSGFATVPVLRDALVLHGGVLTDAQLNDAIAISQASPGPLGLYLVIVGYFVAGIAGAAAGVLALVSPALLAIPIARLVARGQSAALQGACSGMVIAACALMVVTGIRLIPEAAPTSWHLAMIVVGAGTLVLTPIKPIWIILGAAVVGLVLR